MCASAVGDLQSAELPFEEARFAPSASDCCCEADLAWKSTRCRAGMTWTCCFAGLVLLELLWRFRERGASMICVHKRAMSGKTPVALGSICT